MFKVRRIAWALGMTSCLLGATAAVAAAAPSGGKVQLFVTHQTAIRDKVLFTGAIGDYGKAISENASGKVDPNGSYEQVTLKQGGFLLDVTGLTKALNSSKPQINKTTCSVVFSATGSGIFKDGTGAYAGISGKVAITATFSGIAPKTAKGCNLANSAPFYGSYQSITATGHVSFS